MMRLISFTGCRNDNENISSLDIESVNCEIIEDIDVFCEKPVKAGIYKDYSTELLLNKLHAYHFFLSLDKDAAKNIDDVELDMVERK